MKVYVCTDHPGHWPVGTASVIFANDEAAARTLLRMELEKRNLYDDEDFTLIELAPTEPCVYVLRDGDY